MALVGGVTDSLANFYKQLWKVDESGNSCAVRIPETVIFKHRLPRYWYFTSRKGKIKRKHSHNMSFENILSEFSKNFHGLDIVASHLTFREDDNGAKFVCRASDVRPLSIFYLVDNMRSCC